MQIELLNRWRWRTLVGLANTISEYVGIFCTRPRRHFQPDYEPPVTHEPRYEPASIPA